MHRPPTTQRDGAEWLHRFCARVLAGFGVKFTLDGEISGAGRADLGSPGIRGHHRVCGDCTVVFFSKAELEHTPVLGYMATGAGTVYVERGAGGSALRARKGCSRRRMRGCRWCSYPEGTTTNGTHVLPFRSGLLAEALERKSRSPRHMCLHAGCG